MSNPAIDLTPFFLFFLLLLVSLSTTCHNPTRHVVYVFECMHVRWNVRKKGREREREREKDTGKKGKKKTYPINHGLVLIDAGSDKLKASHVSTDMSKWDGWDGRHTGTH